MCTGLFKRYLIIPCRNLLFISPVLYMIALLNDQVAAHHGSLKKDRIARFCNGTPRFIVRYIVCITRYIYLFKVYEWSSLSVHNTSISYLILLASVWFGPLPLTYYGNNIRENVIIFSLSESSYYIHTI